MRFGDIEFASQSWSVCVNKSIQRADSIADGFWKAGLLCPCHVDLQTDTHLVSAPVGRVTGDPWLDPTFRSSCLHTRYGIRTAPPNTLAIFGTDNHLQGPFEV